MDRPSYSVYLKCAVRLDMVCEPKQNGILTYFCHMDSWKNGVPRNHHNFTSIVNHPKRMGYHMVPPWLRNPPWQTFGFQKSESGILADEYFPQWFCWMVLVYFPVIFRILKVKLVRFLQMNDGFNKTLTFITSQFLGGRWFRNPMESGSTTETGLLRSFPNSLWHLGKQTIKTWSCASAIQFQVRTCLEKPDWNSMVSKRIYHLVMTNSLPWKDPPFLRTVNHLFLWAIFHGCVK